MSDFQYIQRILDELVVDEFTAQDGHTLGPAEIHEYLSQVMYSRRSKLNPLWNALLVGGVKDGKKYVSRFRRGKKQLMYFFCVTVKVFGLCRSAGNNILSLHTRNRLWCTYRPTSPT